MIVPFHRARLLIIGLVAWTLLAVVHPAIAQTGVKAFLFPPKVTGFPQVTTYLDVHDANGNFVHGLRPQDVKIQENIRQLPVDSLEEIQPGVQYVIALSLGPALAVRDAEGISRYDHLVQNLRTWE